MTTFEEPGPDPSGRRPRRAAPLAQQVTDILHGWMRDGALVPGDRLPPEHDLADRFGVSRATVRNAVATLVDRGLVVRRQGVGSFVTRGSSLSNPLNEAEDVGYMIRHNGATPSVEFVRVEVVAADARVAAALELEAAAPVLRSDKVFTADGQPVVYCANSVPVSVLGPALAAEAVAEPRLIEPLFDFLELCAGVVTEYQLTSVAAVVASEAELPGLELAEGAPLLRMEEVGFADGNRPVWHSVNHFPESRMRFELVRHRVRPVAQRRAG